MRNHLNLLLLAGTLLMAGCHPHGHHDADDDHGGCIGPLPAGNRVLVLQVDYQSHQFEGGTELTFPSATPTFTVSHEYVPPGDFGNLRLKYQELNEPLFDGSIIWMGCGQRRFPSTLAPATDFSHVLTTDYVTPAAGFENVFNPDSVSYNYQPIWQSVQGLTKVRQYLAANPSATVKVFLYTPSVGIGNPAEWDWLLLLKN